MKESEYIEWAVHMLDEASYGGERGYSDPNLEPPTKEKFIDGLKDAQDPAGTLASVLNEIGTRDGKLDALLKSMDEGTVYEFLYDLVDSMTDEEYAKYVKALY